MLKQHNTLLMLQHTVILKTTVFFKHQCWTSLMFLWMNSSKLLQLGSKMVEIETSRVQAVYYDGVKIFPYKVASFFIMSVSGSIAQDIGFGTDRD